MAYPDILERLREARRSAGRLQSEIAQALGVSQGQMSRYESGAQPCPGPLLTEWAGLLGLSLQVDGEAEEAAPAPQPDGAPA